jgi:hypothetical protein
MTASTAAMAASTGKYGRAFWEHQWRGSGIIFVALVIVSYGLYGLQPGVGAPADALAAFYGGHRTRILIAVAASGLNVLNLMWFAAALRTTLADVGQDGWGAAATASSAALGGMLLVLLTVILALAYSIAGSGNGALTSALNDFTWALVVVSSFPRAMLVMSGSFGLWRAKLISNGMFGAGVAVVVLGVLGGTTWMIGGPWAPDGAYSRFVWPIVGLVWIVVASRVLARSPATRAGW